jgi:hypothetical protein
MMPNWFLGFPRPFVHISAESSQHLTSVGAVHHFYSQESEAGVARAGEPPYGLPPLREIIQILFLKI